MLYEQFFDVALLTNSKNEGPLIPPKITGNELNLLLSATLKKYKIWFADEMRFGLMTNEKRSWNKVGERTRLPNQM